MFDYIRCVLVFCKCSVNYKFQNGSIVFPEGGLSAALKESFTIWILVPSDGAVKQESEGFGLTARR